MLIKDILFKIKTDLKGLLSYPKPKWGTDGRVNYDLYWHERRGHGQDFKLSAWQRERAELILPLLKAGDVVVDVGGGDGAVLAFWRSKVDIRCICVDDNRLVLEQAKQKGIEVIETDLSAPSNWDLIPTCDFLTGFEILEHLPNPEEFILKTYGRVRREMIFSFPNSGYYVHRLRLIFGRFPKQWIVHPGEHLRFWTVKDAKSWSLALGVGLKEIIVYEGVPGLNRLWPALFGQGVILRLGKDVGNN